MKFCGTVFKCCDIDILLSRSSPAFRRNLLNPYLARKSKVTLKKEVVYSTVTLSAIHQTARYRISGVSDIQTYVSKMNLFIAKQFGKGNTGEGTENGMICWPAGVSEWLVGTECNKC